MKFWSLLSQYYDLWSLWSNSSFSFKCAFFAAPSPSTPRRIMFIWLLICKTTKKIVVERNSCFSCVWNSMLQCSATPRKSPGSKGKIGQSPVAIIQCTLHCHHTPLLFLICNPSYCLCGCWGWKVEPDVVDPNRWSCKLVGRCPQVQSRRSQKCRYSGRRLNLSIHSTWFYMFFLTKSQQNDILRKLSWIESQRVSLSQLEQRWKCRTLHAR